MTDITGILPHCNPANPHLCDGCLHDLAGQMALEMHYDADVAKWTPIDTFHARTYDLARAKKLKAMVERICTGQDMDEEYSRFFNSTTPHVDPLFYSDFVNEDAEFEAMDVAKMQMAATRVGHFAIVTAAMLMLMALVAVACLVVVP